MELRNILTLIATFQLIQFTFGRGCITPFGANGNVMHILNCEPIISLKHRYDKNMPLMERLFIQKSFLPKEDQQNDALVCCDPNMNVSRAFESIGAEILRQLDGRCGDNIFKRISFGEERTFLRHPWSVLLVYDTPQRFHCGGALITNRYVLTAGHCVSRSYLPLIGVRLREHNTTSIDDCAYDYGGVEHCYPRVLDVGIEKVIPHEHYSHVSFDNDIALIRLDRTIKFERSMRPICLPQYQDQDFYTNDGDIIGWGATENSTYSDVLLQATVPIRSLDYCRQKYPRRKIDEKKFCFGGSQDAIDCQGDSGGPVVVRILIDDKERNFQMAIVSSGGKKCGDPRHFPSIYLRLSAYRNWIAENLEF